MEYVERIAMAAHNVNKAYCEGCGDKSQPHWTDVQSWLKASIVEGVKRVIENPTITPEELHVIWLDEKRSKGWTYGRQKSISKRTHPCMVPYVQLPEAQRAKDQLFGTAVRGMLSTIKKQ